MTWLALAVSGIGVLVTLVQRKGELRALGKRRLERHRELGVLVDAGWVRANMGGWPLAIEYNGELWLTKVGGSILNNHVNPDRARRVSPEDADRVKALLEAEGRAIAVQLHIG